jgi:hypothetical protein
MNYLKTYYKLISNAQNRPKLAGYKEKHHIIPKSLGGTNTSSNLVELTAKEHFVAHLLLAEIYPCNAIQYALWSFINKSGSKNRNLKISSRLYERLKIKRSKIISEHNKKIGNKPPKVSIGTKFKKEHVEKIAAANRKKAQDPEYRKKISEAKKGKPNLGAKGKPKTESHRKLLSQNNGRSRECKIGKDYFRSIAEASKYLNLHRDTIKKKLEDVNNLDYNFIQK